VTVVLEGTAYLCTIGEQSHLFGNLCRYRFGLTLGCVLLALGVWSPLCSLLRSACRVPVAYLVGAVFGLLHEDLFGANIGGVYASVIRSWDCVVGCALRSL